MMVDKKNYWFDLEDKVVVITGGAGLLGYEHGQAISHCGGVAVIADLNLNEAANVAKRIGNNAIGVKLDVTNQDSIDELLANLKEKYGRVDSLINNAAINPVVSEKGLDKSRFEDVTLSGLQKELDVNLLGAVLCSKTFGSHFAANGGGTIVNISSELGIIGPDQRLYKQKGLKDDEQPVKPVGYSIAKAGLIGLTKYLATYWPEKGVRANAICPGGVEANQSREFLDEITKRIPMARMAKSHEYQALVAFLCSEASSYLTGSVISADGGRSVW
jgi:NAD(P)-dependent dehydrogenase (short-subunit alcohol dehydrogenase family)